LASDKKLINFSKYHKMARIVQGIVTHHSEKRMSESLFSDIQRFQVHYSLKEIPEVQDFLNDAFERSKHHGDLQDLYRRRYGYPIFLHGISDWRFCSLLVEPKQAADATPSGDVRQLFSWTNRSQVSQQSVQVS
jgi:son of sevenless-like protein